MVDCARSRAGLEAASVPRVKTAQLLRACRVRVPTTSCYPLNLLGILSRLDDNTKQPTGTRLATDSEIVCPKETMTLSDHRLHGFRRGSQPRRPTSPSRLSQALADLRRLP